MKTSNIILLGFLITIFAIPLLLIASLNSKVRNKDFTLVKNNYQGEAPKYREGNLESFSVIKFTGPEPDFMECHLRSADTSAFSYQKYDKQDSIGVFVSNDTLYVNYLSPRDSSGNTIRLGNRLNIDLKIKSFSSLVVDGASVFLDSLNTNDGFKLILKNNGKIRDVKADDSSLRETKMPQTRIDAVAELEPQKEIIEVVDNLRSSMNVEIKDLLIFHLM